MTWSDFYLICFAIGFLFSLLSFVAGGLNVHGHWPHVHGLNFHTGTGHTPGASGPGAHAHGTASQSVSPFNFFTIAIFLAWFGGTGYLLTRYSTIVLALGLAISTAVGLVGASRRLHRHSQQPMRAAMRPRRDSSSSRAADQVDRVDRCSRGFGKLEERRSEAIRRSGRAAVARHQPLRA